MIRRERDSKFVIYQVLYIFVITVLALKGADLDLRRVALEDETVRVSVRDSLMSGTRFFICSRYRLFNKN